MNHHRAPWRRFSALAALVVVAGVSAGPLRSAEAAPVEGGHEQLLGACATAGYTFTPELRAAFLAWAKEQARADLQKQGKPLPEEFLAWVGADPDMEAGVYGGHGRPADVLLHLYALQLDLGEARFREFRQLALASAIVSAKEEVPADITPRGPLTLAIGGDPRVPVDTGEPGRALDVNDHIINFLNENTIEEDVVVGYEEEVPELKYDDRGIAIPAPKRKGKAKKIPVTEKRIRTLYAADVLASTELQARFNAYMKEKGHDVRIDCGERVVHWKSRDAVRGEQRQKLNEAYLLFRTAYEAKGLLPKQRDPLPSPSERCAYIIRNFGHEFPDELREQRKWPRFPITAPWPVMTLLVADKQPLREREERWIAFRDEGVFKTYGEYIGGIAQQHDMQSARRLKPYPFTYSTIQMMLKDGGVCGTMGNISARSHVTLGIPACTAGQPGHCAMVALRYDPKTGSYVCKGGQYATGGDDKTTPHTAWYFGEVVKQFRKRRGEMVPYYPRKPMVYHQSIAWAVNHGMRSFLDSTLAHAIYQQLPEADRAAHGMKLLESGLAINPYNFLLTDTAQAAAATPQEQIRFWRTFCSTLAAVGDKPGCPTEGLYNTTVRKRMFARIAELPVPEDKEAVREVFAFLEDEQCDVPAALVRYRLALEGLPALLARTERDFRQHMVSIRAAATRENELACATMAATVKAAAGSIPDRKQRKQWAQGLWELAQGKEKYFGHKQRVSTDATVPVLARLAGHRMPPEPELMRPLLEQVEAELGQSVSGDRKLKDCRVLAARIKGAGSRIRDPGEKRRWFEGLAEIMAGHETIKPAKARPKAKAQRDPCADTIDATLQSLRELPEAG